MSEITSPILFDAAVGYANETADASIRGDLRIAFVAGAEWQWKRDADLSAENARLRTERYQLAYAICGGEDAPGYLDSIDVETIAKVCRDNYLLWSKQTDKKIRLEAENERLRKALEASRDVHAGLADFILNRPDKSKAGLTKEQASGIFADLQRARLAADADLEAKP